PALWTTANRPGKWTRPLPGGRQEPCGPGQGGGPGRGGGGGAADEMVPHSSGHQTRRCRKSCLHLPGAPQRSQLTRGFPEPHRHQEVRSVSSYSVDNDDHPRTAAFFDLDKTIIAKSSTLAFSRSFYQGGLINRRAVLRSAYAQFVYLVGGADHDQMERMREYLSGLVTGWDVQAVKDIVAETLHTIVDPIVYDEAVTPIEEHH